MMRSNTGLYRRRQNGRGKRNYFCKEGKRLNEGKPLLTETALRSVRYYRGSVQPLYDKRQDTADGCACKHCEHASHNKRLSAWQRKQIRL